MQTLKKSYNLKKFKKEKSVIKDFKVNLDIIGNLFLLSYSISGDITQIIIPDIDNFTNDYIRKDELWKNTCFELFIANKHSKSYFEINVSPNYYYNIYCFNDYRKAMQREYGLSIKNIKKIKNKDNFTLSFAIKLENSININELLINTTAVIKYSNEKTEYWALNHLYNKPDFHNFDNFINLNKKSID